MGVARILEMPSGVRAAPARNVSSANPAAVPIENSGEGRCPSQKEDGSNHAGHHDAGQCPIAEGPEIQGQANGKRDKPRGRRCAERDQQHKPESRGPSPAEGKEIEESNSQIGVTDQAKNLGIGRIEPSGLATARGPAEERQKQCGAGQPGEAENGRVGRKAFPSRIDI